MILESWRYVVLAGYRRRTLLSAPCDAYLIFFSTHLSFELCNNHKMSPQGTNITMSNMKRMGVVLYPPPPKDLAKLLDAGFRDAHRFLRTRGMTACVSCLTVRTRTALVRSEGETESSNEDDESKCTFWLLGHKISALRKYD